MHCYLLLMSAPPENHGRAELSFQTRMIPAALQAKGLDHIFHSAQLFQRTAAGLSRGLIPLNSLEKITCKTFEMFSFVFLTRLLRLFVIPVYKVVLYLFAII